MTGFSAFADSYKQPVANTNKFEYYSELILDDVIEDFVAWMKQQDFSRETIMGKKKKVRKFFRDTQVITLQEVTREVRETYKAYLLEELHKGTYKRNYVRTILTDLNVFFVHFLGRPDLQVGSIDNEEISIDRLTREDIDRILNEINTRSDISKAKQALHRVLVVALWTELPRIGELYRLTLGDIKEVTRKVTFHSKKRDRVPSHLRYPFMAEEFLREWTIYKHFRDSDKWDDDAPAFIQVKTQGKPVSPKFVRRMLKDYASRAGITKRISPHIMRKSGGTELAMKNPKLAQTQLGHRSIRTTLTNYTCPNDDDKKRINDILTPKGPFSLDDVVRELSQRYIRRELPEREYISALKSLREFSGGEQHGGKSDVAYQ